MELEAPSRMDLHELRKNIDGLIFDIEIMSNFEMHNSEEPRCLAITRTKLQEAKMWTGKVLEAINKPLPKEYRDHCDKREKYDGDVQTGGEPDAPECVRPEDQDKPEDIPEDE